MIETTEYKTENGKTTKVLPEDKVSKTEKKASKAKAEDETTENEEA